MAKNMLEIIALILASFAVFWASIPLYILRRIQHAISCTMGQLGAKGAEAKHRGEHTEEIEGILKEGSIEMLGKKYPELTLLYGWLKDNHPEVMEWIGDDPMILFELYEKYKPLIDKLTGQGKEAVAQPFDI